MPEVQRLIRVGRGVLDHDEGGICRSLLMSKGLITADRIEVLYPSSRCDA